MRLAVVRTLSLASYLGLIAWVMAWIVFLGELEPQWISLALILFAGPLLIPLRGILAGRDKPLVWGALISLGYALHGGTVAWTGGPAAWLGWIEVALSLTYLVSASYFVRWRAMAGAAA